MRKNIILTLASLLILSIFLAGCTSNSPTSTTTPVQTTASQLSTIDPSDMALTLSDIPAGFTIKDGTELVASDMAKSAIENGWEKGYSVGFERTNNGLRTGILDSEMIQQSINVYPIANLNQVMTNSANEELQQANATVTVTQLPDPGIGDSSQAFRWTTEIAGIQVTQFYISFIKKDVHENLYMGGTSADYETLKNLANVSASKIM